MAQPADSFSSYDAVGNREDLSDIIYDVSPSTTPFLTAIPKVKAQATLHEWQTDSLATPVDTNATIEGDDLATDAATATVRLTNQTQILSKVPRVTHTQEAVNKAGRSSEMAYQVMKRTKEIKTDLEKSLFANKAKVAGSDSVARVLAGIESWITTNASVGATGVLSAGTGVDATTAGTPRAFTEPLLQAAIAAAWDEGGEPSCIYVGSFNKQAMSAFTGNATRNVNAADKTLVNSIDVYKSDFGDFQVKASRHSNPASAIIVDHSLFALATLEGLTTEDLAKTGRTHRKMLTMQATLESRNEKGSAAVYGLTVA